MKKLLLATVAALALASPASAQDNIMTVPLGGGFESYSGTVNGQPFTGMSVPLGGGFQSYSGNVGGQSFNGMSMPLGGGFRAYNGW